MDPLESDAEDSESEELDIENSPEDDEQEAKKHTTEDLEAAELRHKQNLATIAAFRPGANAQNFHSSFSHFQNLVPSVSWPHHPHNLQALLLPFSGSQEPKINYTFPLVSMPK